MATAYFAHMVDRDQTEGAPFLFNRNGMESRVDDWTELVVVKLIFLISILAELP
jgi:hypothetical protein